jgi:hypothetical protein
MTLRHYRNGPEIDVALCGERDMPIFARTARMVTCPACIEKRAALVAKGSNWPAQQRAARIQQLREAPRDWRRAAR